MDRYILLDIDGILNGYHWYKHVLRKIILKVYNISKAELLSMICPINLYWLKKLLKKYPDSKIVLTSSWRAIWNSHPEVQKAFKKYNIEVSSMIPYGAVDIDPTKEIDLSDCDSLIRTVSRVAEASALSREQQIDHFLKYARGSQIVAWMNENNIDPNNIKFVIFEDDYRDVCCYKCLKDHVAICSFYKRRFGIRRKQYKKAVKLLK